MPTLLEKAKSIEAPRRKIITDEHIELAIAWLKGEITDKQASVILTGNYKSGNHLYSIALMLRRAYEKGLIHV